MLLLASLVVVAALVVAVADGGSIPLAGLQPRIILVLSIAAGAAALAGAMLMRRIGGRSSAHGSGVDEVAELRRNLLTAEAIIKAEPQVLVFWDQGQGVRVMAHTLAGIGGLPEDEAELLKFGRWLDVASAQELKKGLDSLFAEGEPGDIVRRTEAGVLQSWNECGDGNCERNDLSGDG